MNALHTTCRAWMDAEIAEDLAYYADSAGEPQATMLAEAYTFSVLDVDDTPDYVWDIAASVVEDWYKADEKEC